MEARATLYKQPHEATTTVTEINICTEGHYDETLKINCSWLLGWSITNCCVTLKWVNFSLGNALG